MLLTRTKTVLTGVVVCFDDDPGGGVADAEVEDFAGGVEGVEGVH
jgi:hypothetical protein